MNTGGLRLDQAPPLRVPAAFFLLAPTAICAAGLLLLHSGGAALASVWAPAAIALTHLGTLGLLVAVMLGALYQMIPVVAGAAVPAVRLGALVHALLVVGIAAMVIGVGFAHPAGAQLAAWALVAAFLLFLLPVVVALRRAPTGTDTVHAMRLAMLALVLLIAAGVLMLGGHTGAGTLPPTGFPGPRLPWIQVHMLLALLCWVGGLLTGVSWTLVPMFWMAPAPSRRQTRPVLAAVFLSLVALTIVHIGAVLDAPWQTAWRTGHALPLAALPAVLAVWVLHPLWTLRAIARRRRPRTDGSLAWWRVGLMVAPLAAAAGAAALVQPSPRWPVLFGWLAIWGWAGTIVLGTLSRIVPFLVWFHRFSPLVGKVRVPTMRSLLPDPWVRRGLGLHCLGLGLGAVAILGGWDPAARALGGVLVAEGCGLGLGLVHVLRARPSPDARSLFAAPGSTDQGGAPR